MEAELLRGMIVDRDTRIANIERKQEELLKKEERLKDELVEAAETNSSQIIAQQTEKTALYHDQQGVLHSLANLHSHLQRQGDSLNEYSLYLQQNGDISANDAQNVMRLQAQLCKAMHSVSIVDRQHEILMAQNEKLLKFQKEELAKRSEDKARIEQSILNDLVVRDTELRGVENKLKDELDEIYKEINSIREQIEDSDSEDDEENDGEPREDEEEEEEEELDEEEKAAKEEMMKLLQERKAEIERLEKEIEEREELIEELQMRAGEEPPPEDSPKVSMPAKKEVVQEEVKEKESPKKEEKKEEPVDEMAARLQQVMASAKDAKVDEVDEMDLLKLAQSRLTGGGDAGGGDGEDEEDSEDEDSEFDESFSEAVDDSEAAGELSAKVEEEEYDPTEKKEDPIVES
mmetsp:Transcript_8415/g.16264  ORF Transcript_8415/g.16264 Transcript_8415/m.16264 type:complete len:404 (-) Transcript_8415:84-1295(-)|eukprot:scaffold8374_cov175-Amphora_coffeaeformis.AAC.95